MTLPDVYYFGVKKWLNVWVGVSSRLGGLFLGLSGGFHELDYCCKRALHPSQYHARRTVFRSQASDTKLYQSSWICLITCPINLSIAPSSCQFYSKIGSNSPSNDPGSLGLSAWLDSPGPILVLALGRLRWGTDVWLIFVNSLWTAGNQKLWTIQIFFVIFGFCIYGFVYFAKDVPTLSLSAWRFPMCSYERSNMKQYCDGTNAYVIDHFDSS